jgi:hypothetical protein
MCLFDWSVDVKDREGYVYHYSPDPNLPQTIMNNDIVATVEALLNSDGGNADTMQALLWFSSAVNAGRPEDKFQLFWFCIETLARKTRNKSLVPDKCPACREPLYCGKCEKVSMHRPYPTQAIGQLFVRFISGDAALLFGVAGKMRHALLHGDLVEEVERECGRKLSELVDDLGRLAWVALLDALAKASKHRGKVRLRLIQPSTFLRYQQVFTGHVSAEFAVGREPTFDEIPNFELSSHIVDRPHTAENGPREGPSPYIVKD